MNAFLMNNQSTKTDITHSTIEQINKPIIIYYFVHPFSNTYWQMEPIIKKLTMEYGAFCSIRPVICPSSLNLQEVCKHEEQVHSPFALVDQQTILLAIKAAALQGNKTGRDYLRNLQDYLFLYQTDIDITTLIHQACNHTNIDLHEFERDLQSISAKKAFESDIQLAQEMEIEQFPTLVFLGQHIEDYSMKIAGLHTYETYTFILEEMLNKEIMEKSKPSLEDFFKLYNRFKTEEIAFIFEISIKKAEKILKQLQLMQQITKINNGSNTFWEII